jgi:hypothetical protein
LTTAFVVVVEVAEAIVLVGKGGPALVQVLVVVGASRFIII